MSGADTLSVIQLVAGPISLAAVCLGIIGNTLCIIVFKKHKNEIAYRFQLFLMITEVVTGFANLCSALDVYVTKSLENKTPEPMARSYIVMWYVAHILYPLVQAMYGTHTFVLFFLCVERCMAVLRPIAYFQYSETKKKRFCHVTVVVSYCLGLVTSVYDCWSKTTQLQDSGLYTVQVDLTYSTTSFYAFSILLRTCLRIIASVGVLIMNVLIIKFFIKPSQIIAQQSRAALTEKKTSIKLLLAQSILLLIWQGLGNALFLTAFVNPSISATFSFQAWKAFTGLIVYISTSINYMAYLITCKEFRNKFLKTFPIFAKLGGTVNPVVDTGLASVSRTTRVKTLDSSKQLVTVF